MKLPEYKANIEFTDRDHEKGKSWALFWTIKLLNNKESNGVSHETDYLYAFWSGDAIGSCRLWWRGRWWRNSNRSVLFHWRDGNRPYRQRFGIAK